eukprot:NODE_1203_length_2562_cov_2.012731.p1 GENE.NODE_1203_length_2562_cov_2.012731~~NODE_1203_length_2562_cov_2.012731.p1  ORF type:complete len:849 (+),score=74.20 NODE_1203_length_2562_cov_2.012731:86-2548(+)
MTPAPQPFPRHPAALFSALARAHDDGLLTSVVIAWRCHAQLSRQSCVHRQQLLEVLAPDCTLARLYLGAWGRVARSAACAGRHEIHLLQLDVVAEMGLARRAGALARLVWVIWHGATANSHRSGALLQRSCAKRCVASCFAVWAVCAAHCDVATLGVAVGGRLLWRRAWDAWRRLAVAPAFRRHAAALADGLGSLCAIRRGERAALFAWAAWRSLVMARPPPRKDGAAAWPKDVPASLPPCEDGTSVAEASLPDRILADLAQGSLRRTGAMQSTSFTGLSAEASLPLISAQPVHGQTGADGTAWPSGSSESGPPAILGRENTARMQSSAGPFPEVCDPDFTLGWPTPQLPGQVSADRAPWPSTYSESRALDASAHGQLLKESAAWPSSSTETARLHASGENAAWPSSSAEMSYQPHNREGSTWPSSSAETSRQLPIRDVAGSAETPTPYAHFYHAVPENGAMTWPSKFAEASHAFALPANLDHEPAGSDAVPVHLTREPLGSDAAAASWPARSLEQPAQVALEEDSFGRPVHLHHGLLDDDWLARPSSSLEPSHQHSAPTHLFHARPGRDAAPRPSTCSQTVSDTLCTSDGRTDMCIGGWPTNSSEPARGALPDPRLARHTHMLHGAEGSGGSRLEHVTAPCALMPDALARPTRLRHGAAAEHSSSRCTRMPPRGASPAPAGAAHTQLAVLRPHSCAEGHALGYSMKASARGTSPRPPSGGAGVGGGFAALLRRARDDDDEGALPNRARAGSVQPRGNETDPLSPPRAPWRVSDTRLTGDFPRPARGGDSSLAPGTPRLSARSERAVAKLIGTSPLCRAN